MHAPTSVVNGEDCTFPRDALPSFGGIVETKGDRKAFGSENDLCAVYAFFNHNVSSSRYAVLPKFRGLMLVQRRREAEGPFQRDTASKCYRIIQKIQREHVILA